MSVNYQFSCSFVCFAFDGARLIGASRAVTDGEYHGVMARLDQERLCDASRL